MVAKCYEAEHIRAAGNEIAAHADRKKFFVCPSNRHSSPNG